MTTRLTEEDRCPLLGLCLKSQLDRPEQDKLTMMVKIWEQEQTTVAFLTALGKLVQGFRKNERPDG